MNLRAGIFKEVFSIKSQTKKERCSNVINFALNKRLGTDLEFNILEISLKLVVKLKHSQEYSDIFRNAPFKLLSEIEKL